MYIQLLKDMFEHITVQQKTEMIPDYYHPDLLLYSNGLVMDYNKFSSDFEQYCQKERQYQIQYDEDCFVENGEKVACRCWITLTLPSTNPIEIEVILIAIFKEGKIWRLMETTSPDWSKMSSFEIESDG